MIGLAAILASRMPGGPGGPALPSVASDEPAIESPTPMPAPTATALASPTAGPAPAWITDLEGQLDCDGPIASLGKEVEVNDEPLDPVATPDDALQVLLLPGLYAWLPATGFEPPEIDGRWALHRYAVDERLKAIAVSTDRFPGLSENVGWEVVGVRACDPSEFDPAHGLTDESTLWLDADGERVRADRIFSRLGPEHCGWEGVTFLHVEDELYLRDVEGVLGDYTARPFRAVDALPADVVDTGLHTAVLRLFTVPDERVVYVRSTDGTIERWGRATEQIGCM